MKKNKLNFALVLGVFTLVVITGCSHTTERTVIERDAAAPATTTVIR
jgi:hypothetical protein